MIIDVSKWPLILHLSMTCNGIAEISQLSGFSLKELEETMSTVEFNKQVSDAMPRYAAQRR